jgi:preprotein translocase subunit YajC
MFISAAFAQDAVAAAPESPSLLMSMLPLVIIFVLFYLLVIRPQSKRIKEHAQLVNSLKAGDKVITGGGLFGTIVKVSDTDMTIEIAPGVNVKAQKHTVTAMQEIAVPANDIKPIK